MMVMICSLFLSCPILAVNLCVSNQSINSSMKFNSDKSSQLRLNRTVKREEKTVVKKNRSCYGLVPEIKALIDWLIDWLINTDKDKYVLRYSDSLCVMICHGADLLLISVYSSTCDRLLFSYTLLLLLVSLFVDTHAKGVP